VDVLKISSIPWVSWKKTTAVLLYRLCPGIQSSASSIPLAAFGG